MANVKYIVTVSQPANLAELGDVVERLVAIATAAGVSTDYIDLRIEDAGVDTPDFDFVFEGDV